MKKRKYKLPIRYYENNLAFTEERRSLSNFSGKGCWGCYKVDGFNYDFLSEDDELAWFRKTINVLLDVHREAHILSIPVPQRIADNMNYLRGIASGELKAVGLNYADTVQEVLEQREGGPRYINEKYFMAKLKKPRTMTDIIGLMKKPYRAVNELLGLDLTEIYASEFAAVTAMEVKLRNTLKGNMNLRALTWTEMEKMIREPFWRGLNPRKTRGKERYYDAGMRAYAEEKPWKPACTYMKVNGETVRRPLRRDITTLYEGRVLKRLNHMAVRQETSRGEEFAYHKNIVISNLPSMPFEGGIRWLYELERSFEFPVWWSIRYTKKDYKEVIQDIERSRKNLDDQLEHDAQADGVRHNQEHLEQDESIEQARYEVQKKKKPFLYTKITIMVAADSEDECDRRAKMVMDWLEGEDIETQAPSGDQFNLFLETMIGSGQYVSDYILRLPPESLAGGMPFASPMVGDDFGFPIGTTGIIERIVKFNPFRPSQIHKSPSCTFTGYLGRGKSTLANLIVVLAAMFGAVVLAADPKGDRERWAEELPWLRPYLNYIYLSAEKEFKGMLDIFRVMLQSMAKDASPEKRTGIVKKAAEHAISILGTAVGINTGEERMERLADAVNKVASGENPCCMKVIETLEEFEKDPSLPASDREIYGRLAKSFRNLINVTAYGHLLFGEEGDAVMDFSKPINIMITRSLVVPAEGTKEENFTYAERVGMATLLAMSAIGIEFSLQSRELLKIFVQDEAKMLKRSSQSQAQFTRMVTQGRTENAAIYIIGHNISDLGDGESIKANIGTRFCFGTKSIAEAREILEYLGLDKNSEELQKLLTDEEKFGTGRCLMKDIDGRVSILDVDLILEEFKRAFSTVTAYRRDA